MDAVEREAVRLTAMLAATEDWAPLYSKTPEQHAELLNRRAELELVLTKFFRAMARSASDFVNWDQYNYQVRLDYNVEVIVNEQQLDQWDGSFIKVTLQTVNKLIMAGVVASELNYQIPLGIQSTSAIIQNLSTREVAKLVGKRVEDDGSIIDNPNPEYNVLETVRKDIAESVKTSLGLGETTDEAILRMRGIIADPMRAELIAQTEAVNAYQAGVTEFGILSKAVGKEWVTAGAVDVCTDYEHEGPVPFDHLFGGYLEGPTAHPRCKCAKRLIYQEEWNSLKH